MEKYNKEIEAGWFAIKNFISKEDYAHSYVKDGVKKFFTVNPNCVVAMGKKTGHLLQPKRISKKKLCEHFIRDRIIYYKSDCDAVISTGYGRNDEMAKELSFADELNITSAVKKDANFGVILLGIDIDAHNGQRDADDVKELVCKYIKDAYWERSTGGKGWHGYVKIKYDKKWKYDYDGLEKIKLEITRMTGSLDLLRKHRGYKSKIDKPAGLPYKIKIVNDNPYRNQWETLLHKDKSLLRFVPYKSKLWKKYVDFLDVCFNIDKDLLIDDPLLLKQYLDDKQIQQSFHDFNKSIKEEKNTDKSEKYFEITFTRALKLPFFGADASTGCIPKMENIKQFHNKPYYDLSSIQSIDRAVTYDFFTEDGYDQIELLNKLDDKINNVEPELDPNSWEGWDIQEFSSDQRKKSKSISSKFYQLKYPKKIAEIRDEKDTMKRTRMFISAFILYLNRIPTVDEAQDEYIRLELNRNEGHTQRRASRFKGCIDFFGETFDVSKATVDFSGWSDQKQSIIDSLKLSSPDKLTYKQGKSYRKIKMEEVAYIYYIIHKYFIDRGIGIDLSYKRASDLFQKQFKKKCSGHKFNGIIDLLEQNKLIRKSRGYIVGYKGKTYSPITVHSEHG